MFFPWKRKNEKKKNLKFLCENFNCLTIRRMLLSAMICCAMGVFCKMKKTKTKKKRNAKQRFFVVKDKKNKLRTHIFTKFTTIQVKKKTRKKKTRGARSDGRESMVQGKEKEQKRRKICARIFEPLFFFLICSLIVFSVSFRTGCVCVYACVCVCFNIWDVWCCELSFFFLFCKFWLGTNTATHPHTQI